MELLGPGNKDTVPMRTTIAESFGIQLKVSPESGNFLYELKVPLHPTDSTSQYFISANKNSLITIVLESSSPETDGGSMDHTGQNRKSRMDMSGDAFGGSHHNGMEAGGHHRSGYHEPAEPFSGEFCIKLANVK